MFNPSLQRKLDLIDDVMFGSPGNYYIKDLQGRYIYLNQNSLDMFGSSQVFGKTDTDFGWSAYSQAYQEEDKLVLQAKKSMNFNQPLMNYKKQIFLGCTQKKPFYHNSEIVGVTGVSIEIPHDEPRKKPLFLAANIYIDNRDEHKLILSKRQAEILHYLLQGLSARLISLELGISSRTVEHHVLNMREANHYASLKELLLHAREL